VLPGFGSAPALTTAERCADDHATCFVQRGDGPSRSAVYDDELLRTAVGWRIASTCCRFIVADGLADRPAG
jgi:hypothetical protein